MKKKVSFSVMLTLIILSIALTVSVTMVVAMRYFSSMVGDVSQRQEMYNYIDEVDKLVRANYTVDEDTLRTAMAQGYMRSLNDEYAKYLTAEEYKAVQADQSGSYTGFGLEVAASAQNRVMVSYVAPDSPAGLALLKKGDVITSVDGEAVTGTQISRVNRKLTENERIQIAYTRDGKIGDSAPELTANIYQNGGVSYHKIGQTGGYIRLRTFSAHTPEDFKKAYTALSEAGIRYLIFDVRGNQGGAVENAEEVITYLTAPGAYVSYTAQNKTQMLMDKDSYEMTLPSITLINGNTAGEAELFAGVLRDFSKTTLLGTTSAGKNTVQEYYSIDSDQAALRLTVGSFTLLRSEKSWNGGLKPDKTVSLTAEQDAYFELLAEADDGQLQAAVKQLENSESAANAASTAITTTTTTAAPTTTTTPVATTTQKSLKTKKK